MEYSNLRTSCGYHAGNKWLMERETMNYRKAIPADASRIVDFQLRMAMETEAVTLDPAICGRGVEGLFAEPSRGSYFVAQEQDQIAGSLMITYEWSDWRAAMVWWIQSVYVAPEWRRRGIYAGLYDHVKALVEADPSVGGIRLYVDRRNTAAQQVYQRLGMNGEHYVVYEWMKKWPSVHPRIQ
jgi:ribosomal protein S18 acetylase RimI-like enzyme